MESNANAVVDSPGNEVMEAYYVSVHLQIYKMWL